jgi:hypothetical protein
VILEFFSNVFTSSGPVVRGGGLRGGRWTLDLSEKHELLRLHNVVYLPGLRVSGTVRGFLGRRPVGHLRLTGAGGSNGVLRWTPKVVSGRLDGKRVRSRSSASGASAASASLGSSRAQVLRVGRRLAARRLAPR